MVQIILVRHGETDWNTQQVFRGRVDVALNKVGLAQAKSVGVSLQDRAIDAIYSSPLSRAFETAHMLAEDRNIEVELERGFIDIDFGVWQGLSHHKVKEDFKDLYKPGLLNPIGSHFLMGRVWKGEDSVKQALERIVKNNPGKTLAIVSHRVVYKVLLCTILGLELSHFWYIRQDTCAVNGFDYKEGNYYLTLLNDTCHLKAVHGASPLDF